MSITTSLVDHANSNVPLVLASLIAEAVLYLESAGVVTGEILHVDGGQSAGH